MLINFKSPASGDVIMFEKNARELLTVLGKNPDDSHGVVTVEQLPVALTAIKLAMAASKESQPRQTGHDKNNDVEQEVTISLHQRAAPLFDLLERSLQDNVPVTWGV